MKKKEETKQIGLNVINLTLFPREQMCLFCLKKMVHPKPKWQYCLDMGSLRFDKA